MNHKETKFTCPNKDQFCGDMMEIYTAPDEVAELTALYHLSNGVKPVIFMWSKADGMPEIRRLL